MWPYVAACLVYQLSNLHWSLVWRRSIFSQVTMSLLGTVIENKLIVCCPGWSPLTRLMSDSGAFAV